MLSQKLAYLRGLLYFFGRTEKGPFLGKLQEYHILQFSLHLRMSSYLLKFIPGVETSLDHKLPAMFFSLKVISNFTEMDFSAHICHPRTAQVPQICIFSLFPRVIIS